MWQARHCGAGGAGRVEVVRRVVVVGEAQGRELRVAGRRVALGADGVALGPELDRVRLVAVRAAHAAGVHPRLQERAVLVVLLEDLPVGLVEPRPQQREVEGIVEGRAGQRVAVTEGLAPGVAGRALLDLRRGRGAEAGRHPGGRVGDVGAARAVAGLAADADLGHRRGIGPGLGRVVAAVAGGVALGAARLPALVGAGPVEAVAGRRRVAGEDRVPAPGLDVPGDVEGLGAAGLGRDQVLLQRVPAGDADHLEGPALARRRPRPR